jgi:hypothetical protein
MVSKFRDRKQEYQSTRKQTEKNSVDRNYLDIICMIDDKATTIFIFLISSCYQVSKL